MKNSFFTVDLAFHTSPQDPLPCCFVSTLYLAGNRLDLGRFSSMRVASGIGENTAMSNPVKYFGDSSGRKLAGGGNNIVNVILTDMRALDTLGEVVVLAVVALGIAALATSSQPTSQDKAPNDKAPDDKASDNKAQQEVAT